MSPRDPNPSSSVSPLAPTQALDRALASLAAGDVHGTLQYAAPALSSEDSVAVAADLVGRGLAALDRSADAVRALTLAVDRSVRHGLVAQAIASALTLRTLDPKSRALALVARTFGADAPEGPAVPPPSLVPELTRPLERTLTGDALVREVIALLDDAIAHNERERASVPPRPRMPLWGALPTAAFERFIDALSVRVSGPGEVLMREGEPGTSAFVVARGEVRISRADPSAPAGPAVDLAVLGPGAIVGEMALVTAAPRAATVTSVGGALLLEAPRDALDAAAADVREVGAQVVAFCRRRLVDNVLRTSPILREMPASERDGLATLFETRAFEPGEALIREGDTGAGLHLIAAGSVEVVHHEAQGDALRLARLGPGGCVGEISLVLRRPATASVRAIDPAVSLVLPAERFLDVVRKRPTLLSRLYELAIKRQDETLSVIAQAAEEIDDSIIV